MLDKFFPSRFKPYQSQNPEKKNKAQTTFLKTQFLSEFKFARNFFSYERVNHCLENSSDGFFPFPLSKITPQQRSGKRTIPENKELRGIKLIKVTFFFFLGFSSFEIFTFSCFYSSAFFSTKGLKRRQIRGFAESPSSPWFFSHCTSAKIISFLLYLK